MCSFNTKDAYGFFIMVLIIVSFLYWLFFILFFIPATETSFSRCLIDARTLRLTTSSFFHQSRKTALTLAPNESPQRFCWYLAENKAVIISRRYVKKTILARITRRWLLRVLSLSVPPAARVHRGKRKCGLNVFSKR